jgi:hypothetical protein
MIIAVLLGCLVVVVVFHVLVDSGHHEGNPRKEDVPSRELMMKTYEEFREDDDNPDGEGRI